MSFRHRGGLSIAADRRNNASLASYPRSSCYRKYRINPRRRRKTTGTLFARAYLSRHRPNRMIKPSVDQVLAWLNILLDPRMNREPEEFYVEQELLQKRRDAFPEYTTAATGWVPYAEEYWQDIRPLVERLFTPKDSWNFTQWVLELVRQTWPEHYSLQASSYDAILDLTDSLCDGTTSPLHIAAFLGMPSLCNLSEFRREHMKKTGFLGSPLFCALAGAAAPVAHILSPMWKAPLLLEHQGAEHRQQVIRILSSREPEKHQFQWKRFALRDLSSLAFVSALANTHTDILKHVLSSDKTIDTLTEVFELPSIITNFATDEEFLPELITYVVDYSMLQPVLDAPEHKQLRNAIWSFIEETGIKLKCGVIDQCSDEEFAAHTSDLIIEEEDILLERLLLDPRFDINMPSPLGKEDGTVIHMAVSGNHIRAVEILLRGSKVPKGRDSSGRTPLMVSESTEMLALLIDTFKLKTTDVDNDGRNIWHYSAATNDLSMLVWLSHHDPETATNLSARTNSGLTPFDEALIYSLEYWPIGDLTDFLSIKSSTLAVLRCLVRCKAAEISPLIEQTPSSHIVTAWGDVGLIDDLQKRGADFLVMNKDRQSALHHINALASPDLVRRVQRLCGTLPIQDVNMRTPAENVLLGCAFRQNKVRDPVCISKHAYSWLARQTSFSEETYKALLTPEVLSSKDNRGRGLWQRMCEDVLPQTTRYSTCESSNEDLDTGCSISLAVKCLLRSRAIRDYERETGKSAASCFFNCIESFNFNWVSVQQLHYDVLEHSNPGLTSEFYKTAFPSNIVVLALQNEDEDFVGYLIRRGVPLDSTGPGSNGLSLFEHILLEDNRGVMLKTAVRTSSVLSKFDSADILANLRPTIHRPATRRKLLILIDAGFLSDHAVSGSDDQTLLINFHSSAKAAGNKDLVDYLESLGIFRH